jgi:hypothetical protein
MHVRCGTDDALHLAVHAQRMLLQEAKANALPCSIITSLFPRTATLIPIPRRRLA